MIFYKLELFFKILIALPTLDVSRVVSMLIANPSEFGNIWVEYWAFIASEYAQLGKLVIKVSFGCCSKCDV